MKRNAFIFLIIFLINTGFYGVYQVMIFRAKWNASLLIRNGNHPERLQILSLSNEEAKSCEGGEITYHGKLFDLAKRIVLPDSVVLFVYADNDEQNILTQLSNYFKSDESSFIPMGEKILRIKTLLANPDQISQRTNRISLQIVCIISFISNFQKASQITNRQEPVPSPPPELLPVS